jgi:hypothetical protein
MFNIQLLLHHWSKHYQTTAFHPYFLPWGLSNHTREHGVGSTVVRYVLYKLHIGLNLKMATFFNELGVLVTFTLRKTHLIQKFSQMVCWINDPKNLEKNITSWFWVQFSHILKLSVSSYILVKKKNNSNPNLVWKPSPVPPTVNGAQIGDCDSRP